MPIVGATLVPPALVEVIVEASAIETSEVEELSKVEELDEDTEV